MSPLLFVIVTDPFIRAIKSVLHPQSAIRAYADDIAIILGNIWREGPAIASLFHDYKKVTCLALKDIKCVIVPLWKYNQTSVKNLILEVLPSWPRFKVEDAALYLGLWIGPGAGHKSWVAALCKFRKQVETVLAFRAGIWISCLLYRVFAFSSLGFVAQAKRIPDEAFKAEKKAILKILSGPGNWISLPIAFRMDIIFKMPVAFPSLKVVGLASKVRLAMTVFPNLVEQRQQLEKGILANEESSLISLGQHNWWRNAILLVLHDAVEDATTHGAITTRRPLDWNAVAALKSPEKVKSIQTLLVHSLTNSFYPTSPEELFCRRFDRWDYLFKGSKEGAAKRAQLLLTSICKKVPPAVLAAWMHTALNGWCTARRFQTQGPCRLSRSCRGEDSV